jgi:ABC-type transport system involved in multi-copper enzyme maturation permease subunit
MNHDETAALLLRPEERPKRAGYVNAVAGSAAHAVTIIMRRKRFAMAAIIAFMPVLIPLALAFLSKAAFADEGNVIFVKLCEQLHMPVLAPLLALFFASMLVAEDVETGTIPYVLTRPIPRSAWVLGRFLAYLLVATSILGLSIIMTFAASATLSKLSLTNTNDLLLLGHYILVALAALVAYGALAVFLGVFTKRPIVYGVLLLYGWQKIAMIIPGVVDFLTISKYVQALYPAMATQRNVEQIQTALGTFQKQIFVVSASRAVMVILLVAAVFLVSSIIAVRRREYGAGRTAGS